MNPRTAVIFDLDHLKSVVKEYQKFDELVFDVETRGTRPSRDLPPDPGKNPRKKDIPALDVMTNEVGWLSLAGPGRADVIPMGHPSGPKQLFRSDVFEILQPLFWSDRRKIGHSVIFDLLSIAKYYGHEVPPPPYGDTWGLIQILNENLDTEGGYNLENLVKYYLGYKYREKLGEKWTKVSFERAARYSYLDAKLDWLLWWKLRPMYDRPGREKLLWVHNLEMRVIEAAAEMRQTGAPVRREEFVRLIPELEAKRSEIEARLYHAAGYKFNINSTPQKRKLLYKDLGLKTLNLTDTGEFSTDKKTLASLAKKHPVVAIMQEYSDVNKLLSTYVRGFLPHIDDDGRIRANYNLWIPKTGRASCSGPNLQNIPIRSNENYEATLIRSWFCAPPGWVLIVGDYGQIELRVLAHQTRDPTLLRAFRENLDLHRLTASHLYDIPEDQVTKEQRSNAKNCNFNLAFEGGAGRLVILSGISMAQAKKEYTKWHKTYPGVKRWGTKIKEQCWQDRYVEDLFGRRRRLPGIRSADQKLRAYSERQAVNFPIQGTAATIAKLAMVRIHDAYLGTEARLILQVHDEFIALAPEDFAEEGVVLMREAMEGVTRDGKPALDVPLPADINIGPNWAEAK